MFRAGNLPESSACPTAIDAYHRSRVISNDYMSAPSGAFHWWDIGADGHVAMATTNGWAMMASCHVSESWGDCIGVTSVSAYSSTTGAKYLGWSYDYAGAEIADVHHQPGPTPSVPLSATEQNGVPDTNYYKRQQIYVSSCLFSFFLSRSVHTKQSGLCGLRRLRFPFLHGVHAGLCAIFLFPTGVTLWLHRSGGRGPGNELLGWNATRSAQLRVHRPGRWGTGREHLQGDATSRLELWVHRASRWSTRPQLVSRSGQVLQYALERPKSMRKRIDFFCFCFFARVLLTSWQLAAAALEAISYLASRQAFIFSFSFSSF